MSDQRETGSGAEDGRLQGARPAPGAAVTQLGRQKNKTTRPGPSSAEDGHVAVSKPGTAFGPKGTAGPKPVTGDAPSNSGGGVTGFTGS